jgi:uncharacterized protein YciI
VGRYFDEVGKELVQEPGAIGHGHLFVTPVNVVVRTMAKVPQLTTGVMDMFVIQLRFSTNKANAGQHMEAHNAWLKDSFDKGIFLLAGTIQPKLGGAIFAHNATLEQIQAIVKEDPFVAEGVVAAEIIEITPSKAAPQLAFLLPK